MSFYTTLSRYNAFDFDGFFKQCTDDDIDRAIARQQLRDQDFLTLLSPVAAKPAHLEAMAQKARQQTIQYFGRTIQLFAPLYISNYCSNHCAYCGFNHANDIGRRKLDAAEIDREARAIAATGIQHILLLTGEAKKITSMDYLLEAVAILRRYFASVSIEIFPLELQEYKAMQEAGVDGLTLFQETYDEAIYKEVHLAGKKRDFHYRLNAPERGAMAGFRTVNVGALLGLGEKRSEFFFTGLHARYIDDHYLDTEVAISLPRFNPAECGDFTPNDPVDDRSFVQFLLAFRLFMPRAGITVSTRESAAMRDNLMGLGATRFSAGVSTSVGGYSDDRQKSSPQFEITDERSVREMAAAIASRGFQVIYKDWDRAI
ncbi:MAG: 2-iminoacetate synthase ThiH [Deltaproteobacteria bacterium]|nr:MAG: 2-iminoacetate synthase ThiH [Deltaproteobacteria bacterium]